MKKTMKLAIGIVAAGGLLSGSLMAEPLSLGIGAGLAPNPYKGDQKSIYPVPIINYENEHFYIKRDLGYYLWNDGSNQLAATLYYSPLNYDPKDGHNGSMRQLDKRRSSVFAGIGYHYRSDWGTLRANLSGDVLNNSNGFISNLSYVYSFQAGDFWVAPGVGVEWTDSKFNSYYFGIDRRESARSGLSRYNPGSSWSPYGQVSFGYALTSSISTYVAGRYTRLDREITGSPMVNQNYVTSGIAGVTYTF